MDELDGRIESKLRSQIVLAETRLRSEIVQAEARLRLEIAEGERKRAEAKSRLIMWVGMIVIVLEQLLLALLRKLGIG
jgi:hypothetical protein